MSEAAVASLVATKDKLELKGDRALATQFPVRSREAVSLVGEFYRIPGNANFEAKSYRAELQGLIDDRTSWTRLCAFELRVPAQSVAQVYRQGFHAMDNDLGSLEMLAAADAADLLNR